MTQILSGIEIAKNFKNELTNKVLKYFPHKKPYIAIIFLWDNPASQTYVSLKKKFGKDIGIDVEIFWQTSDKQTNYDEDLQIYKNQDYDNIHKIIELINYLNFDKDCVWILVQLPLPPEFLNYKSIILSSIAPEKDIDWMWWVLIWLSAIDLIDFIPATPKAVFYLLEKYNFTDFQWKTISILWQSNLVWKPLAMEFIKRWATVYITNHYNDKSKIQEITKKSDFIISCTGKIHLIDEEFLSEQKWQTIVDVWYWYINWKPAWDVQIKQIHDKVSAYTPVPWGIGPLTVACLFDNIFVLQDYRSQIKNL